MEGSEEVQVPSHFLCPISLEIMSDPVTLPTGITYDRDSIEHWLHRNNNHCPVTNQPLSDDCHLIIPNHTLRRLIQSWCAANASLGLHRLPAAPPPPLDKARIAAVIQEARLPPHLIPALKKLHKIVDSGGDRSKRCVEATPGVLPFLASVISTADGSSDAVLAGDEAVSILNSLQLSDRGLRALLHHNPHFVSSLTAFMRRTPTEESRAHAVLLLKPLLAVIPAAPLMNLPAEVFEETVRVLEDRISYQAMKAALQVLYGVCAWGKNAAKAVRAGAAAAIVELLLDEPEKRACEMLMVVLDELCGCADGRAALVGHAAGLAVVAKKMVRVSAVATESAVRMLYAISLHSGKTTGVVEEMLQAGVVSRLCLLLQVECGQCTREMAKEMLRMHFVNWRSSPCLTPHLKALYPTFVTKP